MKLDRVAYKDGIPGVFYPRKKGSRKGELFFTKGEISTCQRCGDEFLRLITQQKNKGKGKNCSGSCAKAGSGNTNFKRGFYIDADGYVKVLKEDGGYIQEHRVVMERHLGHPIGEDKVVHHKNHCKTDNRLENLEVMTKSNHMKLHRSEQLEK